MERNDTASLTDLLVQVKITNKLLAAELREKMKQQELIALLASTDATNREIAEILNTTDGTVRAALKKIRDRQAASDDKEKET